MITPRVRRHPRVVLGLALALALHVLSPASARADATLVEENMLCPVVAVTPGDRPDAPRLRIARGSAHGLVKGGRGDLFAAREGSGIDGVVARVELVEVRPDEAVAVVLSGSATDLARVTVGAHAELRALVPKNVHRGLLFRLYIQGVEFLDNMRLPIVDPRELLTATSDVVEKKGLAAMVVAGREVVEFTRELAQIQTRTRWVGKSVADILSANDERDYEEFLRFVLDYPGKYIGKPWKISETYATWLINFAPPAHVDRIAELRAATPAARVAIAKGMQDKEVISVLAWQRDVVTNIVAKDAPAALVTLELLEQVVKARYGAKPPDLVRAELAQMRARILHTDPKRRAEAIQLYRQASALYLDHTGPEGDELHDDHILDGIVCLNNVAALLADSEKDDEALAEVAAIRRLVAAKTPLVTNPMYASHLALSEVYPVALAARLSNNRGQYREAIDMLMPLVERCAATGAVGARQREMDALDQVAWAHKKLGQVEEAAAIYQRIGQRAAELVDDGRRANVEFKVGDMFYDQSRYAESAAAFQRSAEVARAAALDKPEAKALAARGQALWGMGDLAAAIAEHERAMALRDKNGDKSGIAWQLLQVAKIRVAIGDREAAEQALLRARGIYQELGEKANEADVLMELGDMRMALKQVVEAEKMFFAARDIFKKLKRAPMEAIALQRLATARIRQGDDVGGKRLLDASIALHHKTGDRASLIGASLWMSRVMIATGDPKGARRLLEQLLPKDAAADPGVAIDVMVDLGYLDLHLGDAGAAARRAADALTLATATKDVKRTFHVLMLERAVSANRGDLVAQVATLSRALDIARAAGNRPDMVNALQLLAWVKTDVGALQEAKALAEEALALSRQNDDPYAVAWSLNTLSKVHQALSDVREELRLLDEAYPLMLEVNERYGKAAVIFNRGIVYARLRDTDKALAAYHEAEAVGGPALDAQFKVALFAARGNALVLAKRRQEAEPVLRQGLALARVANPARVPDLLVVMARLASELGRHDEAIALATEASELEAARGRAGAGGTAIRGRVLAAAGKDDEAIVAIESAVAEARRLGSSLPWEAMHQLALIRAKRGERKAAIGLLQDAAKEIERGELVLPEDSSARYHEDKVDVFRLLVKLLLADGQVDEAFQFLERSKVAELRDLDKRLGAGNDRNTALAIELDVQAKRLQKMLDAELAAATPNADKVKQLDDLISQSMKRRAEFMESLDRNDALFDRYAVRPLQLEKLQEYLREGVLVVAPVVLDDSLVVFAMTKDALTHYTTPVGAGQVDELVGAFVREVDPKNAGGVKGRASIAKLRQQGKRLYDLLLAPAFEAMGTPKTLVVSATGALRYLPFAALHDGAGWVVERSAVVSVTALDREKFAQAAPRGGPNLSMIALVDPDGTLPSARVELAEVQKVFSNVEVLEGQRASSDNLRHKLRVPGYDIVHFATHGRLDPKNPELSNILLADKSLSYADIPTLAPARTQLVVLSACQTAVLAGGSGLEIAGLAYQFQRSRVHSVLASLWEVSDRATAELMARFYQEVKAGQTYADALAATQRALVTSGTGFDHPGYWAPFVLMGTP